MLITRLSTLFKKSARRMQRRGKDWNKMEAVLDILIKETELPSRYRDHKLTGDFEGCRECHIETDWLLIYRLEGDRLLLVDTGSHADLFG